MEKDEKEAEKEKKDEKEVNSESGVSFVNNVNNVNNVKYVKYDTFPDSKDPPKILFNTTDKYDKIDILHEFFTDTPNKDIFGLSTFDKIKVFLYGENKPNSYENIAKAAITSYDTIAQTMNRHKEYFQEVVREGHTRLFMLSDLGKADMEAKIKQLMEIHQRKEKVYADEAKRLQQTEELATETQTILNLISKKVEGNSVYLDFSEIALENPAYADALLNNPEEVLLYMGNYFESLGKLEVRIKNLPASSKLSIEDIRAKHLNKLIVIEARSVSLSSVRPVINEIKFECPSCGSLLTVLQTNRTVKDPNRCSCGRRGGFKLVCSTMYNAANLMLEDLQERTENPNLQRVKAIVKNDLTSSKNIQVFIPGNEIRAVGIIRSLPIYMGDRISISMGYCFDILSAELFEPEINIGNFSDEEKIQIIELAKKIDIDGLDEINSSFAPQIYGYEPIKNALIMQLCNRKNEVKKKPRNKPNILLIGDPGVAKTVLGDFAIDITPGSRKAVGGGSSAVGITASVVKEDESLGGYRVEPGALVLAKELLFLDEMNNLNDEDKPRLQEGMGECCYDDQTEILTENGWKFFKDLKKDEKVATLSKEHKLEFHKPSKHIEYFYEGNMIEFKSRQCNLLVTPQHRMYVSRKHDKNRKGYDEFKFIQASELKDKRFRIKRDAQWDGENKEYFFIPSIKKFKNQNCKGSLTKLIKVKMDDWLEFLGYYLSEGSINYQKGVPYNVIITQSEKNTKIRAKIMKCIGRMEFKYCLNKEHIIISSKQLASYLTLFGRGARNKFILKEYKTLNSNRLRILVEALVDGDGYRRNGELKGYVTSSKKLVDDFQELLLMIGLSGNIYQRTQDELIKYNPSIKGRKINASGNIYEISIIEKNTPFLNHHKKWMHVNDVYYKGKVYCVEVKHNIIFVRRNGKPCWSGNSVTVNKANLHIKLKVTAGVLAAANPKSGAFKENENYISQFNIPAPIINRFDEIFIMHDTLNEEKDHKIADIMIERERKNIHPKYEKDFLKKFFVYIRNCEEPTINDKIKHKLNKLYTNERQNKTSELMINPRFMEALIRLVKASAKIRLSNKVEEKDIQRSIDILSHSHFQTSEYKHLKIEEEKLDESVSGPTTPTPVEHAVEEHYNNEEKERWKEERKLREDYEQ